MVETAKMIEQEVVEQFEKLGGKAIDGFPVIDSQVFQTGTGVPYLKRPGVALIAKPAVNLSGMQLFLDGFDPRLGFKEYLTDPVSLPPAEYLAKVAGQVCYASYGSGRTKNKDADIYLKNIIESGHGSVLEHPNFSFLVWGISRSVSHEWVRHRAGKAYSQLSQRYVSGAVLRFVERPEYQNHPRLHLRFEKRIEAAALEYKEVADELLAAQKKGDQILSGERKTDLRKKVQQAARSVLPNETETVMAVTGNVRAWRHVINMRASEHAEVEIRQAAFEVFLCLALAAPILFSDFEVVELPDGTKSVKTNYPKV